MNEKCTTDQDNGMAQRDKRTTRTTANVCDVNDLIHSQKKANHTLQTMRLQHLRLCTAANTPELVNDGLQMKQCLIAVWSGLQQTVVDEAVDEWVDEQKISF